MKKAHAKGMGLFHLMSLAHDLNLEKPVHDGRDEQTTYAGPDLLFCKIKRQAVETCKISVKMLKHILVLLNKG
jgi:hypothetical protein